MFYKLIAGLAVAAYHHRVYQGEIVLNYSTYITPGSNRFGVRGKLFLPTKWVAYCGLFD